MNIQLLFITAILALTLTACKEPSGIDITNQPNSRNENVMLRTTSPDIPKALDIKDKRALISVFGKDGKFNFYARNGTQFIFTDKKPKGNPIRTVTIDVYQNSPECFHIRPGDGFPFWYPEDCPHSHP